MKKQEQELDISMNWRGMYGKAFSISGLSVLEKKTNYKIAKNNQRSTKFNISVMRDENKEIKMKEKL